MYVFFELRATEKSSETGTRSIKECLNYKDPQLHFTQIYNALCNTKTTKHVSTVVYP